MRKFSDEDPRKRKPRKVQRTPAEVDAILRSIADQMTRGEWSRGRSHINLARAHGVREETARMWAKMASRMVVNFEDAADMHEVKISTAASHERNAILNEHIASKAIQDGEYKAASTALRAATYSRDKAVETLGAKYDTRGMPGGAQVNVNLGVQIAQSPEVKLLFDTILGAVRSLPNGKEAARAIVAAVEKLDVPISRAMIGPRETVETTGEES